MSIHRKKLGIYLFMGEVNLYALLLRGMLCLIICLVFAFIDGLIFLRIDISCR